MPVNDEFRLASVVLEELFGWIAHAQQLDKEGKPLDSCRFLQRCAELDYHNRLSIAVSNATLDLASVAEGEFCIQLTDTDPPVYFASAHELAAFVPNVVKLILGNCPLPIKGERKRLEAAGTALSRCKPLLSMNTSQLTVALKRERAKLLDRRTPETRGVGDSSPLLSLSSEDAAILKTLLQAGVTLTVWKIVEKITLGDKTIRKRLRFLRGQGLVEEPVKKKGHGLTLAGMTKAKHLPPDAGNQFFPTASPGR
jgi:hypothetical protein